MSPTILVPGGAGGEVTVHQVGDVMLLAVALGEAEPPGLGPAGLQAQLAHEGSHRLAPSGYSRQRRQIFRKAPGKRGPVRGGSASKEHLLPLLSHLQGPLLLLP
jgi:hypothetical protein